MNKTTAIQRREIITKQAVAVLKEKYTYEQIRKIIDKEYNVNELVVPTHIFNEILSPLESTIKYLKENKEMKFSNIAIAVNRDQRAVGVTYRAAVRKMPEEFIELYSKVNIPVKILANRKLSAFENIVIYLKQTMSLSDIARLLNKNNRTIWTIYNRSQIKLMKNSNK